MTGKRFKTIAFDGLLKNNPANKKCAESIDRGKDNM